MRTSIFSRAAWAAVAATLLAGSAMAEPSEWWAPYGTDSNTLGLWHFDDVTGSTGPFLDASGNGNDGTLNEDAGGVAFLTLTVPAVSGAGKGPGAGLFGTALDYDENQNEAVAAAGGDTNSPFNWGAVPNNSGQLNVTNAVTFEAWIKPTADDLAREETYIAGCMNGAGGWNFGLLGGTLFLDILSAGTGYHYAQEPSVTLVADTWAHVAGVLTNDGTTTTDTIYVNGVQVASNSWANSALPGSGAVLHLGVNGADRKYVMLRSQLDEVRLSNVAREFAALPGQPGDHNGDGKVDAADYTVWRDNPDSFGGPGGYAEWKANFGAGSSGSAAFADTAVPEPATVTLLLFVGLLCGVGRISRRSRTR